MHSHQNANAAVVLPGATIGILGGGQLGRMLALAGRTLGYRFVTLDPTPDGPCAQVSDQSIVAPYDDLAAAAQLADASDVITYEFENVDAAVAAKLESQVSVPQGSRLLFTTQHRLREKRAIEAAGAPVAPYRGVATEAELLDALQILGFPAVLKTATGGYDGKGQWLLRTQDDASAAISEWRSSGGRAAEGASDKPLIVEQFVPFEKEISVVVARSTTGQVRSFPVAENIHHHHILHVSIVPARVSSEVQTEAQRLAERIATHLGSVGLLAVEMFVTADGQLFINELAPRPHNSGHYTQDACVTSQFEQHIRAICGLPLGSVQLLTPVVMVNVLGQHVDPLIDRLHELPDNVKVHLYGKAVAKTDRKMGHLNVIAPSVDDALETIHQLGIWS